MGAAGCAVLLATTWFAAFHVGVVGRADQSIFSGFYALKQHGPIDWLAWHFAKLCNPRPYTCLAVIPIVVALARGRPRVAMAVAALLLGANLTTEVLKPVLAEPRATSLLGFTTPVASASWPSGHATAAMSLALACVIASPALARPTVAALGALFAVVVSYSFLTLGWHYPSDVIGGFLVATTWALLTIAGLKAAESRKPWPGPAVSGVSIGRTLGPLGVTLAGAVAVAVLAVLTRLHEVASYAVAHQAFVVGATAIAVCSVALSTAIVLTVRR